MKGIPIKFRGVNAQDYTYVYGLPYADSDEIVSYIYIPKTKEKIPIIIDSVVQLIAYDIDGKELYEGDDVVDSNSDGGAVYSCGRFIHHGNWDSCRYYLDPEFIKFAQIKKRNKNTD